MRSPLSELPVLALFVITSTVVGNLSSGDTLIMSARYGNFIGMSGGCARVTEVLESVAERGDTTFYQFAVVEKSSGGFFEDPFTEMHSMIIDSVTILAILSHKPSSIQANTTKFDNLDWILSEHSTLLFYQSIRPIAPFSPIPLGVIIDSIGMDDYFVVRVSDTSGMKWTPDEHESGCLVGYEIRYEDSGDTVGTVRDSVSGLFDAGKNLLWLPNGARDYDNPLRSFKFETSSLSFYLDESEMIMGEGLYSIDFYEFRPKPVKALQHDVYGVSIAPHRIQTRGWAGYLVNGRAIDRGTPGPGEHMFLLNGTGALRGKRVFFGISTIPRSK